MWANAQRDGRPA